MQSSFTGTVISQNDYSESRSLYLFFCILLIFSFLAFFLNFDGFARSSFIWYWFSTQFLLYKTLLVLQNSQQWSSPLLLDWSCGHCRCVILEKNKSWIFKFYLKSGNHQIEEFPVVCPQQKEDVDDLYANYFHFCFKFTMRKNSTECSSKRQYHYSGLINTTALFRKHELIMRIQSCLYGGNICWKQNKWADVFVSLSKSQCINDKFKIKNLPHIYRH